MQQAPLDKRGLVAKRDQRPVGLEAGRDAAATEPRRSGGGVGEQADDLRPFAAIDFARGLVGA